MTESVRHSGNSPAGSGTTFDPVHVSMRQRTEQRRDEPSSVAGMPREANLDDSDGVGIDPGDLSDEDLIREMHSLHRTRLDTLRHAADTALGTHLRRTAELETEYLTRYPGREIDDSRLRDGI